MKTEKELYTLENVCKELKITRYTLNNWYSWEKKSGRNRLTSPIVASNLRGKPRRWTKDMIIELKNYQKGIVMGPHGLYGCYTNPYFSEVKKYKKLNNPTD